MPDKPKKFQLLLATEVAKEMRCSIPTVYHWIRTKKLKACKPGRHLLIKRTDLDDFIFSGADKTEPLDEPLDTGLGDEPLDETIKEKQTTAIVGQKSIIDYNESLVTNIVRECEKRKPKDQGIGTDETNDEFFKALEQATVKKADIDNILALINQVINRGLTVIKIADKSRELADRQSKRMQDLATEIDRTHEQLQKLKSKLIAHSEVCHRGLEENERDEEFFDPVRDKVEELIDSLSMYEDFKPVRRKYRRRPPRPRKKRRK